MGVPVQNGITNIVTGPAISSHNSTSVVAMPDTHIMTTPPLPGNHSATSGPPQTVITGGSDHTDDLSKATLSMPPEKSSEVSNVAVNSSSETKQENMVPIVPPLDLSSITQDKSEDSSQTCEDTSTAIPSSTVPPPPPPPPVAEVTPLNIKVKSRPADVKLSGSLLNGGTAGAAVRDDMDSSAQSVVGPADEDSRACPSPPPALDSSIGLPSFYKKPTGYRPVKFNPQTPSQAQAC